MIGNALQNVNSRVRSEFSGRPRRAIAAASLLILAVIALVFGIRAWSNASQTPTPPSVYFINEETGELVAEPQSANPPLNDASGKPVLVRAALYSRDGGKTKTAAYYEKYTDEAKRVLDTPAPDPAQYTRMKETGRLVRLPEKGANWVPAHLAEGQKIQNGMPTGDNVTYWSVIPR